MLLPNFEQDIISKGIYSRVVGIDEVGRGAWAGPVYVGAYIYTQHEPVLENVNDSKKLRKKVRESIYSLVQQSSFILKFMDADSIDIHGVGKSISMLISQIILELNDNKTFFIIDGQFSNDFGKNTKKAIKADRIYYSVAMSSILAKVTRDNVMKRFALEYPFYDWENNVGYPAPKHLAAIREKGITKLHRKSYKPLAGLS